ncbi:DNA ligase 1 [Telopea speciosissima]|uniref:DNA ligase 1 n=1 Tax=Telopea speciosissima TaxID=54955 RepID=UPI001CC3A08B|nr:DNA ligase 1 [Telopea speciosissima]
MMETQRPHRSGSTSSELFICFTSRPSLSSGSSMKISSKSILSPARTDKLRESTLSLSSSLSRRLRSNGSMKGGQASPMFPTGNKKRGSTFENPEPSSPKVTCIGQVRVKKKKQGKKMRARSTRRGEASFRKTEQPQDGIQQQHNQECLPHRNQRWVHIPLTICEALREFNCFLPCRSRCSSANEREKEEKEEKTTTNTTSSGSCDAVFARWLMAIQEGQEEKGTEIALMVGEEKTRENTEAVEVNVMDIDEKEEVKEEIEDEEDKRVSICIPPRNALLLMRCRSEPFRVSSLSNRFWDSPATKENEHVDEDDDGDSEDDNDDEMQAGEADEEEEDDDDDGNDNDEEEENVEAVQVEFDEKQGEEEMATVAIREAPNPQENEEDSEMQGNPTAVTAELGKGEEIPVRGVESDSEKQGQHDESQMEHTEGQILENGSSAEALEEVEKPEIEANAAEQETKSPDTVEAEAEAEAETETETEAEGRRTSSVSSSSSSSAVPAQTTRVEREGKEPDQEQDIAELAEAAQVALEETVDDSKEVKEPDDGAQEIHETAIKTGETQEEICAMETPQNQQQQKQNRTHEDQSKDCQGEGVKENSEEREGRSKLPDCLLLMMFEPKLSMEVSKETWVSSTDFIRCRPEKPLVIPKNDESKKSVSTDSNPAQQQQHQPQLQQQQQQQAARKSCSNLAPAPVAVPPSTAAPPSMAAVIEQKLVNAGAYEPFVLTRCKSEPVRSSVKLAPEACFWKNRRLDPHRPTTLGVGQAGLGF